MSPGSPALPPVAECRESRWSACPTQLPPAPPTGSLAPFRDLAATVFQGSRRSLETEKSPGWCRNPQGARGLMRKPRGPGSKVAHIRCKLVTRLRVQGIGREGSFPEGGAWSSNRKDEKDLLKWP